MLERTIPSPWLDEVNIIREHKELQRPKKVDIAIIGGGISGVTTAYSLIRNTNLTVAIVEGRNIASGATGYNAGQALAEYEMPISELMETYGADKTRDAHQSVTAGFRRLRSLLCSRTFSTWYANTYSYEGLSTLEQLQDYLQEVAIERRLRFHTHHILINDTFNDASLLSSYAGLYRKVPSQWLQNRLHTRTEHYVAAAVTPVTLLNPARLCYEMVSYLERFSPDRFNVFEQLPAKQIDIDKFGRCRVYVGNSYIESNKVVLCTNGYNGFSVRDVSYPEMNHHIQHNVYGMVGYMATVFDTADVPWAASYLEPGESHNIEIDSPFIYATGRPSEGGQQVIHLGGPIRTLEVGEQYDASNEIFPNYALQALQNFVTSRLRFKSDEYSEITYMRHGLMAYRVSQMREVGRYYNGASLFLNRACCGIGLSQAFAAAERITSMIQGKYLSPSVFDPLIE